MTKYRIQYPPDPEGVVESEVVECEGLDDSAGGFTFLNAGVELYVAKSQVARVERLRD